MLCSVMVQTRYDSLSPGVETVVRSGVNGIDPALGPSTRRRIG